MELQTFKNKSPFGTCRLEKVDGIDWIVSSGVPIVEGVLNGMLAPLDEFGAFVKDWDGVPLVLRHPKQNNGSARVPNPDVPVIGRFFGASLDPQGKRLVGEYWFNKAHLLSFDEGRMLHDDLLAGKMIETSTGYYANIDTTPGQYLGLAYTGTQREIHPDHIAILPDEIGACSLKDGCGVNRNSLDATLIRNMTGNLPAEAKKIWESVYKEAKDGGDSEENAAKKAWGAVKRSGWTQGKDEKWVQKNYAIIDNASAPDYSGSSMIAFMLPETAKAEIKRQFPFVEDDIFNTMHMTLAFLGDTKDMKVIPVLKSMLEMSDYRKPVTGKVQGLARFISGGEQDAFVLTFDSPEMPTLYGDLKNQLNWKDVKTPSEHGFIPHVTLAYIGKDEDLPAGTFEPFDLTINGISLVNGNDVFINVPFYGSGNVVEQPYMHKKQAPSQDSHWLVNLLSNPKQEHTMDMNKQLVTKILNEAGYAVKFSEDGKNVTATPSAAPLSATLTGLESIVDEAGGLDKFKELLANLSKVPASIQAIIETLAKVEGNVQAATVMAQNAAAKAEADKKDVVARLIANATQNPFSEEELNAMSLTALQKLEASYRPTSYAAMGAGQFTDVANAAAEDILGVPSPYQE